LEYQGLEDRIEELQGKMAKLLWFSDNLDFADEVPDAVAAADDGETLRGKIEAAEEKIVEILEAAVERGKNPKYRALEAGRPWKEGDGF
jgi:hypothetical protein